jgi:tetratricopeptide (TPR) repeat protein/DNA-binding XRE family transcriptional regulator
MDADFAELLHGHRRTAGLTQEHLAEKAGVSVAAVGALERGVRRFPRPETVRGLAYALGLTAGERKTFASAARRRRQGGEGGGADSQAGSAASSAGGTPGEAASPLVPRQLPLLDASFTGRAADLGVIHGALTSGAGVAVVAITGMGGVGKTALAVHAAHAVAGEYPDGQVYLDLRGYGTGDPIAPIEALDYLLRTFGLSGPDVPPQVDEATARLRTLLADRRVLILLDNARDAAQVEALLPGSGRSAVLITCRHDLSGMPTARVLRLGLLSAPEGLELLRTIVGGARVDPEPEAAQSILHSCGLLPLALKIAAGRLAARPPWPLTHLADLLRDERRRLDQLEDHELGVRASFDVSIDDLTSGGSPRELRAAAAFTLLGVPDGPDLTVEVAARLLDCDEHAATDALEDLCNLHLVESVAPRRYRLHDLLRMYAKERAQASIGPDEQAAAITRIVDLYASVAWQAIELCFPTASRLPWYRAQPPIPGETPKYDDLGAALSWLDGQRAHLLALIAQATRTAGVPAVSILRLGISLHTFYATRGYWLDCLRVYRTALEVAGDDQRAEGFLRNDLGLALYDLAKAGSGHPDDAIAELHRSLTLFEDLEDLRGAAMALANLSHVLDLIGDYRQGIACGEQAITIYRKLDDPLGEALAYISIGNSEGKLGGPAAQRAAYEKSIALSTRHNSPHHLAIALFGSGIAHRDAGDIPAALDHLRRAATNFKTLNDQLGLAEALDELGVTYRLTGDPAAAIDHLQQALTIATQYDDGHRRLLILEHLDLALNE